MIKGIITLLGILYIIEIEPIFLLIYFIGIVISLAIIIYKEGIIYISLILIIVYSTALIILFGFIMMKGKSHFSWSSKFFSWLFSYNLSLPFFSFLSFFFFLSLFNLPSPLPIHLEELWIGGEDKIRIIGETLYSSHSFEIFLSALLLLFPIFSLLFLS